MQKLYIIPTPVTPEIIFSPEENNFIIRGTSCPEDVRALYYPVIEWIKRYVFDLVEGEHNIYSTDNPLRFKVDMHYFNSSSAKFFYDIFLELKKLSTAGIPISVEWLYDEEDTDLQEAGYDISLMADMEFTYTPKKK